MIQVQEANGNGTTHKNGAENNIVINCDIKELFYGTFKAVRDTRIPIQQGSITAFIGPSGCGKSTVLRSLNRMNDLVRGFRFEGPGSLPRQRHLRPDDRSGRRSPAYRHGLPAAESVCDEHLSQRLLRAAAERLQRRQGRAGREGPPRRGVVGRSQRQAAQARLALSGGQQQRLCIARAIATEPAVLLMDEPCSALDPIATRKIEELMTELKQRFTIAIVTHNLQQAQRVADKTGFLYVDTTQGGRTGYLVEFGDSRELFENPREKHTQEYIRGEFG